MKIELCAATMQAVRVAHEFSFDRIELCQTLELGGITPSPGMTEYALAMGLNVNVLIRPRPGGFFYSEDEFELILRDVREAKDIGAHGIVVGVLNESGLIDRDRLNLIMDHAEGMDVTFHRAFDDTYEFEQSMDILIAAGVKRILSSGMASKVDLGIEILAQMKKYAGENIEIMPGGGVNASNIARIIEEVRPDAIHFSGTSKQVIDENSFFTETILEIDPKKVSRLLERIQGVL